MTIDEAIKELNGLSLPLRTIADRRKHDAVLLGIEALKRVKNERDIQGGLFNYALPWETK